MSLEGLLDQLDLATATSRLETFAECACGSVLNVCSQQVWVLSCKVDLLLCRSLTRAPEVAEQLGNFAKTFAGEADSKSLGKMDDGLDFKGNSNACMLSSNVHIFVSETVRLFCVGFHNPDHRSTSSQSTNRSSMPMSHVDSCG